MSEEHIPPHDSAFDSETEAALPVRRRRVYPEVAKERLIETTIEMLREQPFDSLTVRSIAERADLNKSTIITYFGSIGCLFREASNRLALRSFDQFANSAEVMPYEAPDLVLSIRFRAWLLTSGVDPADLKYEPGNDLVRPLEQRQRDRFGVSETTATVFTQLLLFLVQGLHVFRETHGANDETIAKILELVMQISSDLKRTEEALGWASKGSSSESPDD